MERYPKLIVDIEKLKENINTAIRECGAVGIQVAGVIKGFNGINEFLPAYIESDLQELASSRLEQLHRAKDLGWNRGLTLIRVPMLTEIDEVVEIADMSLNSEVSVLQSLNEASLIKKSKLEELNSLEQWKPHRVILMADLGDLREGFWDKDELVRVAELVEKEMPGLHLTGVGTNLGCYGALVPTAEKTEELVHVAEAVEERIGRRLEIISGGASTSYTRITDGDMPERVNHLRLGENILHARDNEIFHGHSTKPMNQNVFTLMAEVLEVKLKPSYPQGEINVDAFGHKPYYEDRGMRTRALLGVGRVDLGDFNDVFPKMPGIEIMGGSSDHMILDVQDAIDGGQSIKPGDILEFDVNYGSLVFLTGSENVKFEVKKS